MNTGENTGPRQFALHPKLDVAYFDYEQGIAITAFDVDRKSGGDHSEHHGAKQQCAVLTGLPKDLLPFLESGLLLEQTP